MRSIIIFCLLLIGLQANAGTTMINGDLYASLDCLKIGKESTNKIYHFDELSIEEQEWFINHPQAKPMVSNGMIYINLTKMHVPVTNAGYGTFSYTHNTHEWDRFTKENTSFKTHKEAGIKPDNRVHTSMSMSEKANVGFILIREIFVRI